MTVDGRGTDQGGAEPIAVVGIGCRFPGDADTPDTFWELLQSGRNTTAEVPAERWEPYEDLGAQYASVLRNTVRRGSFLSRIDEFDPEFFGISPREAELTSGSSESSSASGSSLRCGSVIRLIAGMPVVSAE